MKNLLAVDDEQAILDLLDDMLTHRGYRVYCTTNPEEAAHILREKQIDLVLLDVHMPLKNGFTLYREFQAEKPTPVLFVTGFPRSFDAKSDEIATMWKDQFMEGTTDIIYKPFRMESLFEKVEGLIGQSQEVEHGQAL